MIRPIYYLSKQPLTEIYFIANNKRLSQRVSYAKYIPIRHARAMKHLAVSIEVGVINRDLATRIVKPPSGCCNFAIYLFPCEIDPNYISASSYEDGTRTNARHAIANVCHCVRSALTYCKCIRCGQSRKCRAGATKCVCVRTIRIAELQVDCIAIANAPKVHIETRTTYAYINYLSVCHN